METVALNARTGDGSIPGGLLAQRIAILVGGTLHENDRTAACAGDRPRIDVFEMQARLGADVFDFSWFESEARHSAWVRMCRALAGRSHAWSAGLALATIPRFRNYDVVYATGEDVGIPMASLFRVFRVRQPRLLCRFHEPWSGRRFFRHMAHQLYLRWAIRRIDRFSCTTEGIRQYLNRAAGVPIGKTSRFPVGVDLQFFVGRDSSTVETSRPYIYSGGMEQRDYPTLIEAVRGVPIDLVISTGSPWSHDRFKYDELLPPNVRVVQCSFDEVRALYQGALAVVVPLQPSLAAVGLNLVVEAWAMCKPLIITRTAGVQDTVQHAQNGILVPPHDVTAMREAVLSVLANPEPAAAMAKRGQAVVKACLNVDHYLELMEGELAALLSGSD